MSEIVIQRAKLDDKKRQLAEMNLLAEARVIELRNILDPYIDDYTTLRMNLGRVEWRALEKLWDEMVDLKKQIHRMETDLNP